MQNIFLKLGFRQVTKISTTQNEKVCPFNENMWGTLTKKQFGEGKAIKRESSYSSVQIRAPSQTRSSLFQPHQTSLSNNSMKWNSKNCILWISF